jgi:TetR/AcrR family transcriptional regulator, cholesterol catabolism regulator
MPGSPGRGVAADACAAPATRTQRRRLATRDRLVAAALELFSEHGYDGTTMDMVADRADLARTTVFNHFPRKDALLLAALADRRRIVGDRLGQAQVSQTGTGDRIRDAITQWAAAYESDAATGAALVRAWVQAGGPYLPGATDTAALFAAALAAGQLGGDVRRDADSQVAGLALLDAAVGALVRWAADQAAPSHRSALQPAMLAAADYVLRGVLASPAR